jgi:hypothetical protein
MPLTESDVLDTLDDGIVSSLDFTVGPVRISGARYRILRDNILAGNLMVTPGTGDLAFYNNTTDILTTQKGDSPPNIFARALLLHECTHALVDLFHGDNSVTVHANELAAYLVQDIYTMRAIPGIKSGPIELKNPMWGVFWAMVYGVIKLKNLNTLKGNGTVITLDELEPIRLALAVLPDVPYGKFKKEDKTDANGLLKKNPFLTVDALPGPP